MSFLGFLERLRAFKNPKAFRDSDDFNVNGSPPCIIFCSHGELETWEFGDKLPLDDFSNLFKAEVF
ncbi:MAG: hypothetical protein QXJ45_07290 [Thermoproteota archaeon]